MFLVVTIRKYERLTNTENKTEICYVSIEIKVDDHLRSNLHYALYKRISLANELQKRKIISGGKTHQAKDPKMNLTTNSIQNEMHQDENYAIFTC